MRNRSMVFSVAVRAILFLGLAAQGFAAAPKGPMDYVGAAKAIITEVTPQQVKADLDAGKPVILLDIRDS